MISAWARILMLGAGVILTLTPSVRAQLILDELEEKEGVGIVEKRGDPVPRGLKFRDSRGNVVTSDQWFDGKRPVVLIMAYYDCPLLCTLTLNAVQKSFNDLGWTLGDEYIAVTVSFDPSNTTEQARTKKLTYLAGYRDEVEEEAWRFMTTDVDTARTLSDAVGYYYKFLPESGEYSHPSAMIFLTPDGDVHNYIENLEFDPSLVRIALSEAADGRIGSIFDRVQFYCFYYDPQTQEVRANAMRIMKVAALLTMFVLFVFIAALVATNMIKRARADASGEVGDES
ncbi:MAG: SCO family protein [Planctomycetota bacterium]